MTLTIAGFDRTPSRGGGQVSAGAVARARQSAPNPYDVELPPGDAIELVASRLSFPTGIGFGPRGELHVVESRASRGSCGALPMASRASSPPAPARRGTGSPITTARCSSPRGVLEGGRIVRYALAGDGVGESQVLIDKLPSQGDHDTNGPVASRGGWVYFGQGVVTNRASSATTTPTSAGSRFPTLHDTPCKDIALAGLHARPPRGPAGGRAGHDRRLPRHGTTNRAGRVGAA